MVSKREGGNYIIGDNSYDKYPLTISQKELCEGIDKLEKLTAHCYNFLRNLYSTNVLNALAYNHALYDAIDDLWYAVDGITAELVWYKKNLAVDDTMYPLEDLWTLADEGFHSAWGDELWERELESTPEKEVVEEICIIGDTDFLHRKRTILWDQTPHGRTSRSITYEDLPITPELTKYVHNTMEKRI